MPSPSVQELLSNRWLQFQKIRAFGYLPLAIGSWICGSATVSLLAGGSLSALSAVAATACAGLGSCYASTTLAAHKECRAIAKSIGEAMAHEIDAPEWAKNNTRPKTSDIRDVFESEMSADLQTKLLFFWNKNKPGQLDWTGWRRHFSGVPKDSCATIFLPVVAPHDPPKPQENNWSIKSDLPAAAVEPLLILDFPDADIEQIHAIDPPTSPTKTRPAFRNRSV